MRVVLICHVYPPEHAPAGVNAAELSEDLTRAGHEVTVITGWPSHPRGLIYDGWKSRWRSVSTTDAGFTLVRCWHSLFPRASLLWRMWYYFSFALSSFLSGMLCKSTDVVLCESTPIFGPLASLLLAKLKGAELIYKVHDVHPEAALNAGLLRDGMLYRLMRSLDSFVCRRARLVLTLSEGMRQTLLARGISERQIQIARHWVDGKKIRVGDRDNDWRRRNQIPLQKFVVLHAGTIGHISGAEMIIEAAHLLRHRREILFLFVGEGPLKPRCETRADERALENVKFLPFQDASVLSEVQATGDVGLVTLLSKSGDSSIPSKMHGYTAAGKPVIAAVTEACETARLISAGDFGLVTPPQDAQALADAIDRLADCKGEAERMGANARDAFLSMFERSAQTKELERLMLACLADGNAEHRPARSDAGAGRTTPMCQGVAK